MKDTMGRERTRCTATMPRDERYPEFMPANANVGAQCGLDVDALQRELSDVRARYLALNELLNTPEIDDFDKAVPLEAAHQIVRWGVAHDAGKEVTDWYWVVGHLAGKALFAFMHGDVAKAKHHVITTAAVLRNWHAALRAGETLMRPGVDVAVESGVPHG